MPTADVVRHTMAGLGWYIRRTPDSAALAEWYGGALGLPLIRGRHPVWFFWGGDALCFELKSDQEPRPERFVDPASAPMLPAFACHDIAATLTRIRAAGGHILAEDGDDVFVLDPDRQLVCLRDKPLPLTSGAVDVTVGASPFPADLAGWGWTICRVPDLDRETGFYRDVLGFDLVEQAADKAVFEIGGSVAPGAKLELRSGGMALPLPRTREERLDAIIFRVDDHDAVNAALKQAGLDMVNDAIRFNSASLTYVATPSGRLIGFEERFEPARYKVPRREFLEDKEAIRRRKAAKDKTCREKGEPAA